MSAVLHGWLAGLMHGGGVRVHSAPNREIDALLEKPQESRVSVPPQEALTAAADAVDIKPQVVTRLRRAARATLSAENDTAAAHEIAGAHAAGISDAAFYSARELDEYPVLTTTFALPALLSTATSARVRVELLIDDVGTVVDAKVLEAEPIDAVDLSFRHALFAARFTPAQRNGRAVKSRLVVELTYAP